MENKKKIWKDRYRGKQVYRGKQAKDLGRSLPKTRIVTRGPNRPVVKLCSPYPRCFIFKCSEWIPAFFNLYDNSLPENQTKRGEIYSFSKNLKSFSLRFLFEKNRFPGDPQKHFGNSRRFRPLIVTVVSDLSRSKQEKDLERSLPW